MLIQSWGRRGSSPRTVRLERTSPAAKHHHLKHRLCRIIARLGFLAGLDACSSSPGRLSRCISHTGHLFRTTYRERRCRTTSRYPSRDARWISDDDRLWGGKKLSSLCKSRRLPRCPTSVRALRGGRIDHSPQGQDPSRGPLQINQPDSHFTRIMKPCAFAPFVPSAQRLAHHPTASEARSSVLVGIPLAPSAFRMYSLLEAHSTARR